MKRLCTWCAISTGMLVMCCCFRLLPMTFPGAAKTPLHFSLSLPILNHLGHAFQIRHLYQLDNSPFIIKYSDSEGDMVTIASADELSDIRT